MQTGLPRRPSCGDDARNGGTKIGVSKRRSFERYGQVAAADEHSVQTFDVHDFIDIRERLAIFNHCNYGDGGILTINVRPQPGCTIVAGGGPRGENPRTPFL